MQDMVKVVDNSVPYEKHITQKQYEAAKNQGVPMVQVIDNSVPQKSAEEKEYLVCVKFWDDGVDWQFFRGRREVYNYLKEYAEDIDFAKSTILVENLPLSGRKDCYTFIKYAQKIYEDGFEVDDYYTDDSKPEWREPGYEARTREMDEMYANIYNDMTQNRISMEDMLNGGNAEPKDLF